MSEETIKDAIKQRVNELGIRKNIPTILLKAPQLEIIPVKTKPQKTVEILPAILNSDHTTLINSNSALSPLPVANDTFKGM